MSLTHYMELLMTNQPWNLILFMAIPVILAEITAITEFFILFRQSPSRGLRTLNKVAGLIAGFYFLGVFVYLVANAAIPLTAGGQWRGLVDILAVGFYLSGVVPLFGISLLELRHQLLLTVVNASSYNRSIRSACETSRPLGEWH